MSLTDVPGFAVGHVSDDVGLTGCTVVLPPPGTVASGEVRGSAPATREFALLAPERTVDRVHAVVLSGGSAFGLAAADGVMRWLDERDIGFDTSVGRVPVVVALSCFDLAIGDPRARPSADDGYAACETASSAPDLPGRRGAGTGCTVGKWDGPEGRQRSGLGTATLRHGELVVSALVAVNAVGWIGETRKLGPPFWAGAAPGGMTPAGTGENTSIGVVATNATLDKVGCLLVAQSGHDGLARAIDPVHTGLDGDALVALATGTVEADRDLVRALAARAIEAAVRSAPLDP
jgi:L-aminopeptidase/D-esterase-like protein